MVNYFMLRPVFRVGATTIMRVRNMEDFEARLAAAYHAWHASRGRTLRTVDGPKVDVWTVRDGLAVNYLEMFDSYGTARALGVVDPPEL